MTNSETTDSAQQPSAKRLLRSTAIAATVATAILVTIVLPAEYGVDPTGIGRVLGLKAMGETKMALAREDAEHAAAEAAVANVTTSTDPAGSAIASALVSTVRDSTLKTDTTQVILAPGEAKEIKLVMQKDTRATFSWSTLGGVVNFDTHADSPTIKYHGYGKGTDAKADQGVLLAAFDGQHGWYWRNRGAGTVTITLHTNGNYQELKRM